MAFINLQPPATGLGQWRPPFRIPNRKGFPQGFADYQPQSFVTPQVLVDPYNSPAILIPDGWGGARAIALPKGLSRGVQGLGQAGCFAGGFAQNMQEWIQGISNPGINSQTDAAVGCGAGGNTPCASPADAAEQALAIAASWCEEANNQSWMGCPTDPNCGDGGVAAAAPYVAQALRIFQGFPASVWTTEAANVASGNYYGSQPAGPCPPGTFLSVANGVQSCNAPGAPAQQYTGDSGPQFIIGGSGGGSSGGGSSTCPSGECMSPNLPGGSVPTPTNGTCPSGYAFVIPTSGGFNPIPTGPGVCSPIQPTAGTSKTTAVLTNLTAPGQQLEVGDQWQLVITGPANSSVTSSATQNGGAPSTSAAGSTNSSGQLTLGGTFGAGDVGSWLETWTVAGATPAQVSFVVANPGTSNPTAGTSTSTSTSASSSGAGLELSFLTNDVSILGQNIPVWGLIAAGIVGLVVIK